jgi:hypothetical protein
MQPHADELAREFDRLVIDLGRGGHECEAEPDGTQRAVDAGVLAKAAAPMIQQPGLVNRTLAPERTEVRATVSICLPDAFLGSAPKCGL